MDRSPRWHKPAGRLDQPARPRRVLAVIRVLVLLAARGRPSLNPPAMTGAAMWGCPSSPLSPPRPPPRTLARGPPPPGGEGGGIGGLPAAPLSPRRPARSDDGADRPADGSAASQPGQSGLVGLGRFPCRMVRRRRPAVGCAGRAWRRSPRLHAADMFRNAERR